MPTEDRVYAACPVCRKQVLTVLAPSGTRTLISHKGRGQRKTCEGSHAVAVGQPPARCQTPGCWGQQADDSIHCPDCRDFYRGRGLVMGKAVPDA